MKEKGRRLIFIIFSLSIQWSILNAQVKFETANQMTINDGLPSNHIRAVAQTSDGFIWLATNKGLSRFDGVDIKTYLPDPDDPNSIFDDRVHRILVDSNQLLLGTQLGFSIFNIKTEKFKNYQFDNCSIKDTFEKNDVHKVIAIEKSRSGEIWVGSTSQGLIRFFPKKDSITCYRFPKKKVAPIYPITSAIDYILDIKQDLFNDSIIWAATTIGLLEINTFTDEMDWFHYQQVDDTSKKLWTFKNIYLHDNGLLYLATWGGSVIIFNPKNKKFKPLEIKNPTQKERQEGYDGLIGTISFISRKSENEIWITSSKGLVEYNTNTEQWQEVRKNVLKENIYYGVEYVDLQNRVWLSSSNGLYIFDPVLQQFIEYNFSDLNPKVHGFSFYLLNDSSSNEITVLPRAANALFHLDSKNRTWRKTPFPKEFLHTPNDFDSRGFSKNPSGDWTFTNRHHLINYSAQTQTFEKIKTPDRFKDLDLRSVCWDKRNRLWVGTKLGGLLRWTPKSNQWEVFKKELEPSSVSVTASFITSIFNDSQNNMWLVRKDGLSIYHSQKDTFYNFLSSLDAKNLILPVQGFEEDKEGRIWIKSSEGQLMYAEVAHPERGIIKRYNLQKMSNIDRMDFLKIDSKGTLWGLSDEGLYSINPKNMEVKSYNLKYGISNPDFFGFEILPNDEFVLGGKNRIWIASPKNLVQNSESPKPYLTKISVLEEPLVSDTIVHYLSHLNLNHWENFFSIGFSAIGYTVGEENEFRYQLEGLNEKWIDAKDQRIANYTNVPSGNYTFKLQVKNNEGVWNEDIFTLPISIATPWWRTIWFYLVSIFAITLLIYALYRFQLNQVLQKERIKTDFERRLLEVEMGALRAQMNPHFLFNCLNSIERYVIKNDTKQASKYLNNFARLIRMILQNSRSNYIKLADEIKTLELYLEMEALRFYQKFQYHISVGKNVHPDTLNIPPMLLQPFIENAIWHGLMNKSNKENGVITLDFKQQNGYLICTIQDNGIGRAAAALIKARRPVTGKKSIGLKITHDRIQMINQVQHLNTSVDIFDLKKEDGTAGGTKVVLKIPI